MTKRMVEWMKTCEHNSCTFTQDRPGAGHPWLYHPYDLTVFVLSGSMLVEFEGHQYRLGPGESCDVPLGLYHRLTSGAAGCAYLTARPHDAEPVQFPLTPHYAAAHQ